MKITWFLISVILSQTCIAQFKLTKLDKASIPKSIQYNSNFVQAVRWTDKTGDNIVILSHSANTRSNNGPEYMDAVLYSYHYLLSGDSANETWKVYDYIKECPFDIALYFVDKAFSVTDLNRDGKAEVWIMYKVSCYSDVSPIPIKLIMYQDNKKYAVRGMSRVQISETEHMGGEYSFDDAFKNGPTEFRTYAEKLWKQYWTEKLGQ